MPGGKCPAIGAFLFALCVVSSGAAADPPKVWPTDYDPRYVASIADSEKALTQPKVDDALTTIGVNDHIRNADGAILMTCFTDFSGYLTRAYDGVDAAKRPKLWTTVAPELWQFYQTDHTLPQNMALRTKQLLGLPEDSPAYFVTEMYVKNDSLFRPAMDPYITDAKTSLSFVGYMNDTTKREAHLVRQQLFDASNLRPSPCPCRGPAPAIRMIGASTPWRISA